MRLFCLTCLLYLIVGNVSLDAQTSRVEFGKNRVQFHKKFKEWTYYEGDRTIVYWYGDGRNVGLAAAHIAETEMDGIRDLLEHSISDKIEIIVYTDLTDLKQSNIGLEDAFEYSGGSTKILDNKIFLYFDGNHRHLHRLIRQGIAGVYIESILFGSSLQEIVQNAVSFNLPDWFKSGLIAYVGEEWSVNLDNELRDLLTKSHIKTFEQLIRTNPQLAGHAFWYYVSKEYGQTSVANLLYLVRINRSVDAGFIYVLGHDRKITGENMLNFFHERYRKDFRNAKPDSLLLVKLPTRKDETLTIMAKNPFTGTLAFVTNQNGKERIYLQQADTGKRKLILKKGFRNLFQLADKEYPHIVWSADGNELICIREHRDKQLIGQYNTKTGKWTWDKIAPYYERIHSADLLDKGRLIFSATVGGVSDIFIYYLSTKQTVRLTNDYYDDLDARFAQFMGRKGVIFLSNRPTATNISNRLDSIIPLQKPDLYFIEIDNPNPLIIKLTDNPQYNKANPQWIDSTHFTYLTEENGNWNRKTGYLEEIVSDTVQSIYFKDGTKITVSIDSLIPQLNRQAIDTITFEPFEEIKASSAWASDYTQSVVPIRYSGKSEMVFFRENQKIKAAFDKSPKKGILLPANTSYHEDWIKQWYISQHLTKAPGVPIPSAKPDTVSAVRVVPVKTKADTSSQKKISYFQSEFEDDETVIKFEKPTEPFIEEKSEISVESNKKFVVKNARIVPYRLAFKTDYITTRLDNSPLFGGLDNYIGRKLNASGTADNFSYIPLGILLTTNFKDVLEDYVFDVGARFPTSFRGGEYFITFHDRKFRWDKAYSYYYSGQQSIIDPTLIDNNYFKKLPKALQFQLPGNFAGFPQFRTKVITNLVQAEFRYPFDLFRSIRFRTTFRNDKMLWKATEKNSLNTRNYTEQRISQRIEYVFDNTLSTGINLLNGTRYKAYTEAVKGLQIQFEDPLAFNLKNGFMGIIGLDFRHYEPILKKSVIAVRFAGEISFGTEKMLNILGGVDNWLVPSFNPNIPLPTGDNIAYQAIVPGLRGFTYNIRNGSSYGLLSAELRIPVLRYFSEKIRSSIIRNFQVVGFFDAGMAWDGFSPFSKDSPINTIYLENPPTVKVKVNYYRDPLVAGVGFGVRTSLLGYFIRADYGYGIESRIIGKPVLYLAFGTDF